MGSINGQDVLAYSFAKSRQGYDRAEVDRFVEGVATEFERLNELLARRVDSEESVAVLLRTELDQFVEAIAVEFERLNELLVQRVDGEESAAMLLRTATRTAEETIAVATKEAEEIRSAAAAEAAELTATAAEEAAAQVEEASSQALEIARGIQSEAARVSYGAKQQAHEAEERVEQLHGEDVKELYFSLEVADERPEAPRPNLTGFVFPDPALLSLEEIFKFTRYRVNTKEALDRHIVVSYDITDSGEQLTLELRNSVLLTYGGVSDAADVTLQMNRGVLNLVASGDLTYEEGISDGTIKAVGSAGAATAFWELIDNDAFIDRIALR